MTTGYEGYEAAGELLRALSAPIRVAIVAELGAGERCVHELVEKLGAPQPLVSQHLRVLRGAGVGRGSRRGREIAYALDAIRWALAINDRTQLITFDARDRLSVRDALLAVGPKCSFPTDREETKAPSR